MLDENIGNQPEILKKWASISAENRGFIIKNHSCFDLLKILPSEEEFSSFICLISEGTAGSKESFKVLLDLQKAFFASQLCKNAASDNNTISGEIFRNDVPGSSGLNSNFVTVINEDTKSPSSSKIHGAVKTSEQVIRHNATVYVHDVPSNVSKKRFKKVLQFAGKFDSVSMCPEDSAADVVFDNVYSANNLLRYNFEQGPLMIDNHPLILEPGFEDDVWSSFNFLENQVVISNIPATVSKTKLRKLFSFGGRIQSIVICPEDFYAVITFCKVSSADNVRELYENGRDFIVDGMPLHVFCDDFSDSDNLSHSGSSDLSSEEEFDENKLYIGNIPTNVNEDELKQMFSGFGRITELDLKRHGKNSFYAFITFQNVRSAYSVLQSSYKKNFVYGETILIIQKVK